MKTERRGTERLRKVGQSEREREKQRDRVRETQ